MFYVQVIWKYFYSSNSAQDHGTLYQLRNKLNRTNVVTKPKNNVNACEDFVEIVTSSLIISSTLEMLSLNSVNDMPSDISVPGAEEVWTLSADERRKHLLDLCRRIYDKYVDFKFNDVTSTTNESDLVMKYSIQLLRMCYFYMEFADAIREGDGGRVLRCWKYMAIIFSNSGNRNYACEAANLLIQYNHTLSPHQASQLLWSRFINTSGSPGKNVPVDLHMEHLNKIAKGAIGKLGSNKSIKAIQRIGRAMGTLSPVLNNFDSVNNVVQTTSKQTKPKAHKDIMSIINELNKGQCFTAKSSTRKHSKFPLPKDILTAKSKDSITKLP